jgi:hypothetical protein
MSQNETPDGPQPALVAYLEALLDRARAGEVQFIVCSAAITPAGEPAGLTILPFSGIGPRVVRWEPPSRAAAYQTTLEGLAKTCIELEKGMGPLKSRIVQ